MKLNVASDGSTSSLSENRPDPFTQQGGAHSVQRSWLSMKPRARVCNNNTPRCPVFSKIIKIARRSFFPVLKSTREILHAQRQTASSSLSLHQARGSIVSLAKKRSLAKVPT